MQQNVKAKKISKVWDPNLRMAKRGYYFQCQCSWFLFSQIKLFRLWSKLCNDQPCLIVFSFSVLHWSKKWGSTISKFDTCTVSKVLNRPFRLCFVKHKLSSRGSDFSDTKSKLMESEKNLRCRFCSVSFITINNFRFYFFRPFRLFSWVQSHWIVKII